MQEKTCAVIGSGLGGLAAAIRLANRGYKVDVFEKNSLPGGKASQIKEKGFRFDTGPSILTMPFVLEDLFEEAKEKLSDYITLKSLDINCKYFYPDGTIINGYSNTDNFISEVISNTCEKEENLRNLLKSSKSVYDLTADTFLFNSLLEHGNLFSRKYLGILKQLNKLDLFSTLHRANFKTLDDSRVIQLFDRYATYNGSNPYSAPATLKIIQYVENGLGAYISTKGTYSITESLYRLALKSGVKFYFNSDVEKIFHRNGKVTGIKTNSEKIDYDTIISNADINFTYRNLLEDKSSLSANIYNRLKPSSSAIVFYWGIEGINPNLEIHNILFSCNYYQEFNQIFQDETAPFDPTVYIYISSKFKSDDAPQGFENWYVMINAPYVNGQNWNSEIAKSRERIFRKIKKELGVDISSKIVFEKVMSPLDIQRRTNSTKGSIYGISSNSKFSAFLRHQNRSKKFKGLYFTGGSVHPGGGIPLVLLSGKIVESLITKYEIKSR